MSYDQSFVSYGGGFYNASRDFYHHVHHPYNFLIGVSIECAARWGRAMAAHCMLHAFPLQLHIALLSSSHYVGNAMFFFHLGACLHSVHVYIQSNDRPEQVTVVV